VLQQNRVIATKVGIFAQKHRKKPFFEDISFKLLLYLPVNEISTLIFNNF
jgi:hypothetical protein